MSMKVTITADRAGLCEYLQERADEHKLKAEAATTRKQAREWLAEARGIEFAIKTISEGWVEAA